MNLSLPENPSTELDTKVSKPNVSDRIIDAFIAKRRKLLIDHDNDKLILTYEESEVRLINILYFIAVTLLIINSGIALFVLWPSPKLSIVTIYETKAVECTKKSGKTCSRLLYIKVKYN